MGTANNSSGAAGSDPGEIIPSIPWLPAPDPGTDPSGGTRDVNGPCKDLMLFCFDPFDMFTFNPECFTCNSGMGCQDCVDLQAI